MKKIQLKIQRSTVIDAVRTETLIRGNIDRATDEKASRVAYHEHIGDEATHMRKLERSLVVATEELKTFLTDYALANGLFFDDETAAVDFTPDAIYLYLILSDRFNEAYTNTLARLSSQYIQTRMLALWWETINVNQAKQYIDETAILLTSIERCFNRIPPKPAMYMFTKKIILASTSYTIKEGYEVSLGYTIDKGKKDDIEVSVFPHEFAHAFKAKNGEFRIYTPHMGRGYVALFSSHDHSVQSVVNIIVEK